MMGVSQEKAPPCRFRDKDGASQRVLEWSYFLAIAAAAGAAGRLRA